MDKLKSFGESGLGFVPQEGPGHCTVRQWAALHHSELWRNCERARRGKPLSRIAPSVRLARSVSGLDDPSAARDIRPDVSCRSVHRPPSAVPYYPAKERDCDESWSNLFSGDVMAQHWSDDDGGVTVMAAKKKATKKTKKTTKKPKPTTSGPGCQTGKKTC